MSSAIISDAMDSLGIHGTLHGMKQQVAGARMCGLAFTAKYTLAPAALGRFADFMDDIPAGAVVAIDNGGRTDVSVWGDTLSLFASVHGFAGTVIDGVCRDIDGTRAVGYPMFSRDLYMRTGKGRVGVESTQAPIRICEVDVHPGDLIFGDETGVVVVPKDRIEEVLVVARGIVRRDDAWEAAIRAGLPMAQVWLAADKA
jgi:regulator of RNase E activity RraA